MNAAEATNTVTLEKRVSFFLVWSYTSVAAKEWRWDSLRFDSFRLTADVLSQIGTPTPVVSGWTSQQRLRAEADWQGRLARQARTALGRRLRELRARIVASGIRLLSWDDIERELAQRRGEVR